VEQKEPDSMSLRGTDGKMIDYIIQHTLDICKPLSSTHHIWQCLLEAAALRRDVVALIDAVILTN
jgi:hypothetical protein